MDSLFATIHDNNVDANATGVEGEGMGECTRYARYLNLIIPLIHSLISNNIGFPPHFEQRGLHPGVFF